MTAVYDPFWVCCGEGGDETWCSPMSDMKRSFVPNRLSVLGQGESIWMRFSEKPFNADEAPLLP